MLVGKQDHLGKSVHKGIMISPPSTVEEPLIKALTDAAVEKTSRHQLITSCTGHLQVGVNVCSGLHVKQGVAEKEHASPWSTLSLDKSKVKI